MLNLKKRAYAGILDYQTLMSQFCDYKAPHRKITELLRTKKLIRVKKGLYILGDEYRDEPIINLMLLANMIYGPSYISQEYALQYYGFIPERVETVTSMTSKRNKAFDTPVGVFQYSYVNMQRFTVGIDWLELHDDAHVLIASPEKAIVDTMAKFQDIKDANALLEHLLENMRIDEDMLAELNLKRLEKINQAYKRPIIKLLYRTLKKEYHG